MHGAQSLRGSRAGVRLTVGGEQALSGYVGVDLGGGERCVAQDLLDAAQVGAALEQVCRRGMAQAVRPGIGHRPGGGDPGVHDPARRPRIKPPAASGGTITPVMSRTTRTVNATATASTGSARRHAGRGHSGSVPSAPRTSGHASALSV